MRILLVTLLFAPLLIAQKIKSPSPPLPTVVFAKAQKSVVTVIALNQQGVAITQGSGVIISPSFIVTNFHVVENGHSIEIIYDKINYKIKNIQYKQDIDLAYLHLKVPIGQAITRGNTDKANIGDKVYAIGGPKGLELTLSDGIISSFREENNIKYIQTTAPISPGSSGGGLFDKYGKLIGITTFTIRNSQNLNFAIPIEQVDENNQNNIIVTSFPIAEQESDFINRVGNLELQNNWIEIINQSNLWILKHSTSPTAHLFLAEGHLMLGHLDDAYNFGRKAIGLDPTMGNPALLAQAFSIMAASRELSNNSKEAVEYFQKAYSCDSSDNSARMGLIRVSLKLAYSELTARQFSDSLEYINTVVRIEPRNPEAWRLKGWVFQQQRDIPGTIQAWDRYVSVKPPNGGAKEMSILAILYAGRKDYNNATRIYRMLKNVDYNEAMRIKNQLPWAFQD